MAYGLFELNCYFRHDFLVAKNYLEVVLKSLSEKKESNPYDYSFAMRRYGELLRDMKMISEALEAQKTAFFYSKKFWASKSDWHYYDQEEFGNFLVSINSYDEAICIFEELIEHPKFKKERRTREVGVWQEKLGDCYRERNNYKKALRFYILAMRNLNIWESDTSRFRVYDKIKFLNEDYERFQFPERQSDIVQFNTLFRIGHLFFWDIHFRDNRLSDAQRRFYLAWTFRKKVAREGFLEYFLGWESQVASETIQSLEGVNAFAAASILKRGVQYLVDERISSDTWRRNHDFSFNRNPKLNIEFERLDQEFQAERKNLDTQIYKFVLENESEFEKWDKN